MHEKLTLKTNKLAVWLTTAWPLVIACLVVGVPSLIIFPGKASLLIIGMMLLITLVTLVCCSPMYTGTYLFLPPTEYKGARLLARLGRHESETEISSVSRGEIIVKQNLLEKALKVCHIRQKGTAIYLRGVPEMETVKAWLDANFPEKTAVMLAAEAAERKAKMGKNGKKGKK
ncbi:MAG: hypothetical protein IJE07_13150 [Clostridia bacterium]|nr:hypothetical protein [Clostridia bacterium]